MFSKRFMLFPTFKKEIQCKKTFREKIQCTRKFRGEGGYRNFVYLKCGGGG